MGMGYKDTESRTSSFLISLVDASLTVDIFELKQDSDGRVDYEKTFVDLCHGLNNMVKKNMYIDTKLSGSTGVLVIAYDKKLYCANVGDSRAVLFKAAPEDRTVEVVPMSEDQKPSDPVERQRILAHGGKIHPCKST